MTAFGRAIRDLNERQSRLLLVVLTFVAHYEAPELTPLVDDDVIEAMAALAATFDTAVRGLIYEHRPASLSAERLANALQPLLAEAGSSGGTGFQRDAALILRRIEIAAREARDSGNRRAFVELAGRLSPERAGETEQGSSSDQPTRIIIP